MDSLKRLEEVVRKKIGGREFVVVSHSEPIVHYYEEDTVKWHKAGGGLVTAIDPVMRACGGTWIAYAAGEADAETVDADGIVKVPPDKPRYALKRLALSKEDVSNYLDGVSNSSLWPWCHFSYVRPEFRDERWPYYRKVNREFADAVLKSVGNRKAFVWVQDYHLSLASKYIKEKRPDITTAQFWHIPWPNAEVFKICPWGGEVIEAMLCNDLLGFQIRYYANNFLDSADQTLQARVDREHSTVFYKEGNTLVREFPISIDYGQVSRGAQDVTEQRIADLRRRFGIKSQHVGVGVDRLDYNKGLAEKFMAIDDFFARNPEWLGKLTFVQVASPSRPQVPAYKRNAETVESLVDDINYRRGYGKWKPIVFVTSFLDYADIMALYRMADFCLVTSLHDGMNLDSKEYVAANPEGVLVLSKFTGASRELKQAILINPYAVGETADAIKAALEMPAEERRARRARMAQEIQENDVYKWASDFIQNIAKLEAVS